MLYHLPTSVKRDYRGKRPNAIRMFSGGGGTDADGVKCVHLETNYGDRFTCTYDRIADRNSYSGVVGKQLTDFVLAGTVVEPLSRARYNEWLYCIQVARAEHYAARNTKAKRGL